MAKKGKASNNAATGKDVVESKGKSKGSKNETKQTVNVPNRELLQRMNFLHQASVLVSNAIYNSEAALAKDSKGKQAERQVNKAEDDTLKNMLASGGLLDTQPRQPHPSASVNTPQQQVQMQWYHCGATGSLLPQSRTMLPSNAHSDSATWAQDQRKQDKYYRKLHRKEIAYRKRLSESGLSEQEIETRLAREDEERFLKNLNDAGTRRKNGRRVPPPPLSIGHLLPQEQGDIRKSTAFGSRPAQGPAHPSRLVSRNLSSHYVNDIRTIARKSVLRLDPIVKRTMCRNCDAVLVPGITSSVKVLPSQTHVHLIRTKCLACMVSRTIPAPPLLPYEPSESHTQSHDPTAVNAMLTPAATAGTSISAPLEAALHSSIKPQSILENEDQGMQTDSAELTGEDTSSKTLSDHGILDSSSSLTGSTSKSTSGIATPADDGASKHGMHTEDISASVAKSAPAQRAHKRRKTSSKQQKPGKLKSAATLPTSKADNDIGLSKKVQRMPVVPGKRSQYRKIRFHNQPQHFVTRGNQNDRVQQ